MNSEATVWQRPDVARHFLTGVRGAIPFAAEQIEVMHRVIQGLRPEPVTHFLDLGCGDGVLGAQLLMQYPDSRGLFIDFSEAMLDAGREKLAAYHEQTAFQQIDYGRPDWVERPAVQEFAPFDVIVSGFSIHHQPDERKREIYQEIYQLLRPGGIFLNMEHVASPTAELEALFDNQMIDAIYQYQVDQPNSKTRAAVASEFLARPDKIANILCDVNMQCDWLREMGYQHVDCYFKCFEQAMFGGTKPI